MLEEASRKLSIYRFGCGGPRCTGAALRRLRKLQELPVSALRQTEAGLASSEEGLASLCGCPRCGPADTHTRQQQLCQS
eukprot:259810-Chlamydomonas_euryale.AAC.7